MLTRDVPRIAVLASHRAPGIEHLLDDPARGTSYHLAVCVTSETDFAGRERIESAGVPVVVHPIRQFHRDRGLPLRNLRSRRDYDHALAGILAGFDVDLVFLTSYLYILTEPMLACYGGRMLNIHDSDLTVRDQNGERLYVGLHATREALLAGARETRATVHLVTERVDQGPLILMSDRFPVSPLVEDAIRWGSYDIIKTYAYAHREWMMRSAWGPLLRRTIELIRSGNVHVVDDVAWIHGMPGPCLLNGVPECRQSDGPPVQCPFLHTSEHEVRG